MKKTELPNYRLLIQKDMTADTPRCTICVGFHVEIISGKSCGRGKHTAELRSETCSKITRGKKAVGGNCLCDLFEKRPAKRKSDVQD